MKNLMEKQVSWLALLVTAFYSLLGSCRSQECSERLVKCARPLERISRNDLSFAVKKEELQELCPEFEAGMRCIQAYTFDCMQEKQREHFNSLYAGTNQVLMELCHDGPYQDEFLKHAPCMQKVQREYELCQRNYQRTTEEMERRNHSSSRKKSELGLLCCAFKEYLECSHHAVRRQCGDDTAQFAKELLDRMSSSLLRDCQPYTDKDCAIGSGAVVFRVQSILVAMMAMLARYFT